MRPQDVNELPLGVVQLLPGVVQLPQRVIQHGADRIEKTSRRSRRGPRDRLTRDELPRILDCLNALRLREACIQNAECFLPVLLVAQCAKQAEHFSQERERDVGSQRPRDGTLILSILEVEQRPPNIA
jgi:hypothetical protein